MEKFEDRSIDDKDRYIEDMDSEEELIEDDSNYHLKGLTDLSISLNENPKLEYQIREIFECHVSGNISSVDTRDCHNALMYFISSDSAYLLLICCLNNSHKYLRRIEDIAKKKLVNSESVVRLLKVITALYGTKIEAAHYKNLHDWKWISPELYTNSKNDYSLELEILKFNGERIFLKMDSQSALNFTEKLIEELSKIPKDVFDEKIDDETREVIISFYEKFFS